uniref:Reverse transcriptase n=1 Tax=Cyanistes caeruleus TaxID=156563 RepID=A0A8C0TZ11_CYACU
MVKALKLLRVSTATQTNFEDLWQVKSPQKPNFKPSELGREVWKSLKLEFYNSIHCSEECEAHCLGREGLEDYPDVYWEETMTCLSLNDQGTDKGQERITTPPPTGEEAAVLSEPEEATIHPPNNGESEGCPVISVPDKNPPCPCCGVKMNKMLGLIDHLLRTHGIRECKFKCAKCDLENTNFHSIACHYPKCKGKTKEPSPGKWPCNVCQMSFQTKIGLGQHKRKAHPAIRNQERIEAAKPKETSARGAHKKCWSEEEENLLIQLIKQYEGNRNINKLIAEHIPSKTSKQISDKRRCLVSKQPAPFGLQLRGKTERQPQEKSQKPPQRKETTVNQLKKHYEEIVPSKISDGTFVVYQEAFQEILKKKTENPAHIISEITKDCMKVFKGMHSRGKNTRKTKQGHLQPKKRQAAKWMSKRAIKKGQYLRFQKLFYTDRGKLARIILDDVEGLKCQIPANEISSVFRERWETPGSFKGFEDFEAEGKTDNTKFLPLITAKEIDKNIKEMAKTSAPGPDDITLEDLCKADPKFSLLTEIFNLWLISGTVPDQMKNCRTVLLPKSDRPDRLKDINNWRPITIGSTVLRLFSRVLTARLSKACPINPRQKGFTRAPGCSENLQLLQLLLKTAKREHNEIAVVFVDIAKAFDTVSHQHIIEGLRQRKVDEHIINLIQSMYVNTSTCIRTKDETSAPINILKGVKQGDPMSPLLFNLALDPLLCKLEKEGQGYKCDGANITAMAFADDLVLLSNSWEGMMRNIKILETFCNITGLKTQGEKCHGFYIKPTKDSYTINDCPPWTVNNTPLNMISPGESEKYLGLQVDPWVGIAQAELLTKINTWLQRIGKAHLKPLQKIDLLKVYTIPRLYYIADHTDTPFVLLKSIDQAVRTKVKEWLHLPACTCDALLYSSTRDGGLGISRLEGLIPSIQARRLHRLAQSKDEILTNLLKGEGAELRYKKLWVKAGGDKSKIPSIWTTKPMVAVQAPTSEILSEWEAPTAKFKYPKPCNLRKKEFEKWKQLVSQGRGITHFENDSISNAWLTSYRAIHHRKLITALQLRANVYPTREFLARGRDGQYIKSCRHCKAENETCSHIIGKCPITQDARIQRHNKICDLLTNIAQRKDWTVFHEPHIRDSNGQLFKPDLIFVKDNQAQVVDVTVRYESENCTLENAAKEKVTKYQHLEKEIQELTNAQQIDFIGFPLGSRGKWYPGNNTLLETLGLSKRELERTSKTLASRALESSVDIIHIFASKSRAPG